MQTLSIRQAETLHYLILHEQEHHRPATIREIGAAFGIFPQAVAGHLEALEFKGYIRRLDGSRGLQILFFPDGTEYRPAPERIKELLSRCMESVGEPLKAEIEIELGRMN